MRSRKAINDYMVEPPADFAARTEPPDETLDEAADAETQQTEVERREAVVGAATHGQRLDKAVVAFVGEFSRSHLQGLIERGHVRVDGKLVQTPARRVAAGQTISVELVPTEESRAFRAEPLPLSIVHEDEQLLVVDKAAGMVVHPAAGNWSGTLLNALLAHHAGAASLPRAGIVHRLDKDTSGLMVVAKTLQAATALARAIAARDVHREYLAIAHGRVVPAQFTVDAPLGRDPQSRVRMAVLASGRPARTDVTVLATNSAVSAREAASALRCVLHTGRTHQIRVHLASRGHPLVADALYGGRAMLGMQRQALHATRLAFVHPTSGEPLAFDAPPPPDFAKAWQGVQSDQSFPA